MIPMASHGPLGSKTTISTWHYLSHKDVTSTPDVSYTARTALLLPTALLPPCRTLGTPSIAPYRWWDSEIAQIFHATPPIHQQAPVSHYILAEALPTQPTGKNSLSFAPDPAPTTPPEPWYETPPPQTYYPLPPPKWRTEHYYS